MAETTARKLRYVGPHVGVEIPALETTVLRNHQIEVADSVLADSLLEQTDNWKEVGAASKPVAADDGPQTPEAGGH